MTQRYVILEYTYFQVKKSKGRFKECRETRERNLKIKGTKKREIKTERDLDDGDLGGERTMRLIGDRDRERRG